MIVVSTCDNDPDVIFEIQQIKFLLAIKYGTEYRYLLNFHEVLASIYYSITIMPHPAMSRVCSTPRMPSIIEAWSQVDRTMQNSKKEGL